MLAEKVTDSKARAYTYAWSQFREYCEEVRREALPLEMYTVVTFLAMPWRFPTRTSVPSLSQ